jgi:transcriptional regulator with XRE-family HTH domain
MSVPGTGTTTRTMAASYGIIAMDYYSITDEKIAAELGQRICRLRQRRGYSEEDLAEAIGVDPVAITLLEKGKCDLYLFVAVLRELRAFGQLERFLKETRVRALELNDPTFPTEGTVMYRRRKADFKTLKTKSDSVTNPKRRTDFTKQVGDKAEKKTSRNTDISDVLVR